MTYTLNFSGVINSQSYKNVRKISWYLFSEKSKEKSHENLVITKMFHEKCYEKFYSMYNEHSAPMIHCLHNIDSTWRVKKDI